MSESNKDNFGKKIFNVFIVLISFGVSFLVLFLITSYGVKNFLQQNETMEKPKITESSLCSRSESYEIAPEFIRAISIVKQKMTFEDDFLSDFENCINVQYDQLKSGEDGPEGVFLFDSSISSLNDLKIFVDNS